MPLLVLDSFRIPLVLLLHLDHQPLDPRLVHRIHPEQIPTLDDIVPDLRNPTEPTEHEPADCLDILTRFHDAFASL